MLYRVAVITRHFSPNRANSLRGKLKHTLDACIVSREKLDFARSCFRGPVGPICSPTNTTIIRVSLKYDHENFLLLHAQGMG
jgi:hypothetical protein